MRITTVGAADPVFTTTRDVAPHERAEAEWVAASVVDDTPGSSGGAASVADGRYDSDAASHAVDDGRPPADDADTDAVAASLDTVTDVPANSARAPISFEATKEQQPFYERIVDDRDGETAAIADDAPASDGLFASKDSGFDADSPVPDATADAEVLDFAGGGAAIPGAEVEAERETDAPHPQDVYDAPIDEDTGAASSGSDEFGRASGTRRWADDDAGSTPPVATAGLRDVRTGREWVTVGDRSRGEPEEDVRRARLTATGDAPSGRSRAARVGAVAILAALAVAAALLWLVGENSGLTARDPRGGVAGAVGRPTASLSPASSGARSSAAAPSTSDVASAPPSIAPADAIAAVEVSEQALRTWTDAYGEVRAEVIAVIRNSGRVAATLGGRNTGYTIAAPDGTIVASGVFARSFPDVIAPGEKGYLIDAVPATFVKAGDLSKLKLKVAPQPAPASTQTLIVEDLTWTSERGALTVSGTVRNDGQTAAGHVVVAAILRDASGRIVCAVYDTATVTDLAPAQVAKFKTSYPASAPVPAAAISRAEGVAFADPGD
ncbi:MAG TPA: FxLYD domain-containing protein [Candidatus Limnocylindrales bacterium]|nr:FxLYD domain-containing protein [Candidatus Limnocylindrales bacterium]